MPAPAQPKIYHILHADRLPSVLLCGGLLSDAKVLEHGLGGTTIGMNTIKQRRLRSRLMTQPKLTVGQCVPFYFCPRSIMLFLIHRRSDPDLAYRGGQEPIVHLECDLNASIAWAKAYNRHWAFTLSNAGSNYFEERADLSQLDEINWDAVAARQWSGTGVSPSIKEGKQAEFLIEESFPWALVERIGVHSPAVYHQVVDLLQGAAHRPRLEILRDWYYL